MEKKICIFFIILLFFSSCIKIRQIDLIGKQFIFSVVNKKYDNIQNLVFKSDHTVMKDLIYYLNNNLKYIENKTSIQYYGYRAILVDNKEVHCIWYNIVDNGKKTPLTIYFVNSNEGLKIFTLNIGTGPDDW